MPSPKKDSTKSRSPSTPAIVLLLLTIAIATACATPTPDATPPPALGATPRTSAPPKPLACSEFAPLSYSPGKPGASKDDVFAALANPDDPLGRARGVLGDTLTTRRGVSAYAAARRALGCE